LPVQSFPAAAAALTTGNLIAGSGMLDCKKPMLHTLLYMLQPGVVLCSYPLT
jgi:hypothetical protein